MEEYLGTVEFRGILISQIVSISCMFSVKVVGFYIKTNAFLYFRGIYFRVFWGKIANLNLAKRVLQKFLPTIKVIFNMKCF